MIIFDLDGTLADCEHRRHLVDPKKNKNYETVLLENEQTKNWKGAYRPGFFDFSDMPMGDEVVRHRITKEKWKPDWQAFYEACDKDIPIKSVIDILEYIGEGKEYGTDTPWVDYAGIQIWSGRSESVREKTDKWLSKNVRHYHEGSPKLKMRPIGNIEPDEVLKEMWIRDRCNHISLNLDTNKDTYHGHGIDFVFDSHKPSIEMWRRRGVFVFNVNQNEP